MPGLENSEFTAVDAARVYQTQPFSSVFLDARSHMVEGGGRFARASSSIGVMSLLQDQSLGHGTYSLQALIQSGAYRAEQFVFSVAQYRMAPNANDYGSRAFIYGTERFQVTFDSAIVDASGIRLTNLRIIPLADRFGYHSSQSDAFISIANWGLATLFAAGRPNDYVELNYIGIDDVPVQSEYRYQDALGDKAYVDSMDYGSFRDAMAGGGAAGLGSTFRQLLTSGLVTTESDRTRLEQERALQELRNFLNDPSRYLLPWQRNQIPFVPMSFESV